MEQYRLNLEEQRIDLELELGADDALVSDLRLLTAAAPLRQRFTEQLMLALHRTGRTPEALQAYSEITERLADELGADPGRSLRDLHTEILRDGADDHARGRPDATAPAMLPADLTGFTGRHEHLACLDELLGRNPEQATIAALTGTGGIGKTTLVLRWAHQVADRFPGGQLFVDLRGFDPRHSPRKPEEAVGILLAALGVSSRDIPLEAEARFGLYRSLLSDRRVLVVVDNAADAEQARPLIPGGTGTVTIVTSRNSLHGLVASHGARAHPVPELTAEESLSMLEKRIGKERVAAEPDAAERIIERCARLPLAIAVAAARVGTGAACTLEALARELGEAGTGLDPFDVGDASTDVRAVLSCSYKGLSGEAARLFRLMGLHPGPDLSAPAAASLAAISPRDAKASLRELSNAHLVTGHRPGRYTFHDLLRTYAAELAEGEPEHEAATARMYDHYLQNARDAFLLIGMAPPQFTPAEALAGVVREDMPDLAAAMRWFGAERGTILTAIERAADAGLDSTTWYLVWVISAYLIKQGHFHDLMATQQTALAAAQRHSDLPAQCYSHRMLALAHRRLNDHETSIWHSDRGLECCRESGDRPLLARALVMAGQHRGKDGAYEAALRHLRQAREIAADLGDDRLLAVSLNAIGWYRAKQGHYEQALVNCELALEISRDHALVQANTRDSIGYIHHRQGRLHEALDCYQTCLEWFRQAQHRFNEAETWGHIAEVHRDLGDTAAARHAWLKAAATYDDMGLAKESREINERLLRLDADT